MDVEIILGALRYIARNNGHPDQFKAIQALVKCKSTLEEEKKIL